MTRYEPRIDTGALTAIDMHVHVEQDNHGALSLDDELMDASATYFRSADNRTPTVADLARRYRAANLAAVIFTVDAFTATGHPALSSADIAAEAVRLRGSPSGPGSGRAGPAAGARVRRPRLQVPPQPAGLLAR